MSNGTKRNGRHFALLTLLLLGIIGTLGAQQVQAQVASEMDTLNAWKANAKSTNLGNQLLGWLDVNNRAIAFNSSDKSALYRRGYLYGTVGCTQSAINDLSRAIGLDPNFAAAYTERGQCYLDKKEYDRALFDLNRAVQLNPRSGDAVLARGRVWLAMGKPHSALADLRLAQQSNMKYAPCLPGEFPGNNYDAASYYIGSCYEAMERPDDAVKYYKASMSKQPVGQVGFLHRYADQPLDTKWRVSSLERYGY